MAVTFEHGQTLQRIERTYYTYLDVLSDAGGLQGAMWLIGGLTVSLIKQDSV